MTVTAPYIDTVPSSITEDGLEEAFEEVLPCESSHELTAYTAPHTDGHPCTLEVEWRQIKTCGHTANLCQARYEYWLTQRDHDYLACVRCGKETTKAEFKWVRI